MRSVTSDVHAYLGHLGAPRSPGFRQFLFNFAVEKQKGILVHSEHVPVKLRDTEISQIETNAHGHRPENSGVQSEELLDCFQTASAASSVIPAALEHGFFCGRAALALECGGHTNNNSQQQKRRGGGEAVH